MCSILSPLPFNRPLLGPGRGIRKKEGVQGFARAALAGGIPCLLATKWNIPLREGVALMTHVLVTMAEQKVGPSGDRASAPFFLFIIIIFF